MKDPLGRNGHATSQRVEIASGQNVGQVILGLYKCAFLPRTVLLVDWKLEEAYALHVFADSIWNQSMRSNGKFMQN